MHSDDNKCLFGKYYSQLYTYNIIHLYYLILKKGDNKKGDEASYQSFYFKIYIFSSSDQSFLAVPQWLTVNAPLH